MTLDNPFCRRGVPCRDPRPSRAGVARSWQKVFRTVSRRRACAFDAASHGRQGAHSCFRGRADKVKNRTRSSQSGRAREGENRVLKKTVTYASTPLFDVCKSDDHLIREFSIPVNVRFRTARRSNLEHLPWPLVHGSVEYSTISKPVVSARAARAIVRQFPASVRHRSRRKAAPRRPRARRRAAAFDQRV